MFNISKFLKNGKFWKNIWNCGFKSSASVKFKFVISVNVFKFPLTKSNSLAVTVASQIKMLYNDSIIHKSKNPFPDT